MALAQLREQKITTMSLEDDIQIRAWGCWARPRIERELGVKAPGWSKLVKSGYRVASASPDIDESYALHLDAIIAALPERYRRTLVGLYVYGLSGHRLSAVYRESRRSIEQDRDAALNMIYGALKLGA